MRFLGTCVLEMLACSLLAPTQGACTTRLVPDVYPTIQVAVDGSSPGDTVLLSPGTYSGDGNHDIEFRGKDIVLTSQSGPEVTVIDCESHRGFYMHQHETRAREDHNQ
jgi:hypothetical protein